MKKSKLLLVALILGVLYLVYSAWYWFGGGANVGSTSSAQAGAAIASAIVMPHLVLTLLAVIFNALGYALSKRPFALVAGILYSVAMVLFPPYFFFVIVQAILSYVAFAKMKDATAAE
ncbi:MAG: hypothetical protein J6D54_09770 [Olsenella sp.]|nr:hypothetical protein [Olsenella sp.]